MSNYQTFKFDASEYSKGWKTITIFDVARDGVDDEMWRDLYNLAADYLPEVARDDYADCAAYRLQRYCRNARKDWFSHPTIHTALPLARGEINE